MDTVVLQSGEGRVMNMGPVRITVQEDGSHTQGRLAVAEFQIAPHAPAPVPHTHHAHEEGFYILEGELVFTVGNEQIRVGQGGWVLVPIGVSHTFANAGSTPARFLNTFTPPQYIHYFEEMAALVGQSGVPPTPQQAREIMSHYDTEVNL